MNLRVPQSWTDADILFREVPKAGPREALRPLSVNAYCTLHCAGTVVSLSQGQLILVPKRVMSTVWVRPAIT
jgi:hypothetical protein